jgi:hypothetical protein
MLQNSNRITLAARLLALIVIPILVMAFIFLYFYQPRSADLFAWQINPPVMAALIGAGYLGGAYYFSRLLVGRRWHEVQAGLPTVGAFVWSMILLTLIHWSRFDIHHFPFQLWLAIYSVTPFLIPVVYWWNRRADPGTFTPGDRRVPRWLGMLTGSIGLIFCLFAITCFIWPQFVAPWWAWQMTPLGFRALAGWTALMGVGGLMLWREPRWSAWHIQIESMFLWHTLLVIAALRHLGDFYRPVNLFLIGEILGLLGFVAIYRYMLRQPPEN